MKNSKFRIANRISRFKQAARGQIKLSNIKARHMRRLKHTLTDFKFSDYGGPIYASFKQRDSIWGCILVWTSINKSLSTNYYCAMQIVVFIIFFPTSVNRDCLRRAASMRCSARYSQEDWEDQFSWRLRRREGDSHGWWRLSWWRWEGSAPGVLRSTHPQLPSWRLPKVPRDWWESSMRRQQPRQQLRRPRQRRAKKWSPRYHLHYSLLGRGSSSNP